MCHRLICAVLFTCLALSQSVSIQQLFQQAVEAQRRGDFTDAIRLYRQILQTDPKLVDAHANLGAALVNLGRFDEGIAEYQKVLAADPNNSPVRLNLALAYYKKGDFPKAAGELESLRRSDPSNARLATLLGDCFVRLNKNAEAVALLAPLAKAHSDDADMGYVLGSALIRTGKIEEGVPLMERVGEEAHSADAYLLAGSTLLKTNQNARALEDLQAAERLNPELPGLHTALGIAEEGAGNSEAAEKELLKALSQNPDDFQANIHLGGILYSRRDLDQARLYIEHAIRIDPSSMFAIYERALVESTDGQVEAAVGDLETVVRNDPKWLDAHVKLAALYYKLHRDADGLRERHEVERLTAEQQEKGPGQPR